METKRKIEMGNVYQVKFGVNRVPVIAVAELAAGGYTGKNARSGKTIKFKTGMIDGDGETLDAWKGRQPAPTPEGPMPTREEIAKNRQRQPKKPRGEKPARKPSGLDAAVRILREAGTPLNTAAMVEAALKKGYWKTGGKTPASTIYAAILREISAKGKASRFRKTGRGMFDLTEAGKSAA